MVSISHEQISIECRDVCKKKMTDRYSSIINIMDKSLGTKLHFWRFCAHAKCVYNFTCLTSQPNPKQYWKLALSVSPDFQHCIGCGGGEGWQHIFKRIATSVIKHRWFVTNITFKYPKAFCPWLKYGTKQTWLINNLLHEMSNV